jgi:membrane protease YdiL (CAAX protease family)
LTRRLQLALVWIVCAGLAACAGVPRGARVDSASPPSPQELDASTRLADTPCSGRLGFLLPGAGQLCHGKTAEGATLLSLTAAELTLAGVAGATGDGPALENPAVFLPVVAVQNVWIYGAVEPYLDEQRARRELYVPQESLFELAAAPFNYRVLTQPDVGLGILGLSALAIAYGTLLGGSRSPVETQRPSTAQYVVATGVGSALFTHVAIGEEVLFRGLIQSSLARNRGPWTGWAWSSAVFGAAHLPNALVLPESQQRDYLLYSVPFITVVGSYLGLTYMWNDYALSAPVAVHFWYDLLVSLAGLAASPDTGTVGSSIRLPW